VSPIKKLLAVLGHASTDATDLCISGKGNNTETMFHGEEMFVKKWREN
jgi:hypothetical protein